MDFWANAALVARFAVAVKGAKIEVLKNIREQRDLTHSIYEIVLIPERGEAINNRMELWKREFLTVLVMMALIAGWTICLINFTRPTLFGTFALGVAWCIWMRYVENKRLDRLIEKRRAKAPGKD